MPSVEEILSRVGEILDKEIGNTHNFCVLVSPKNPGLNDRGTLAANVGPEGLVKLLADARRIQHPTQH